MLIDASYFVAELGIPNSNTTPVLERINWFINKYEPMFLQKLLGYPLYKAFVTGMNVIAPATPEQRMLDILYGAEYTNYQGFTEKWQGLIVTDTPVFNMAGGYVYKKTEYLTAGPTPELTPGASVAVFPDWIGWTPIITRSSPMFPDVDYSYDITTGELALLAIGDVFGLNERFKVDFELRTDAVNTNPMGVNRSCIANYVYYWYRRAGVTQTAGVDEVRITAENSINVSPRWKIASAWNEMHRTADQLMCFLQANETDYPESTATDRWRTLKQLPFLNPIF